MSYALLSSQQYLYKIGDRGNLLVVGLTANGAPYDLTDHTSIIMRLRPPAGEVRLLSCVVEGDPVNGNISYEWDGTEITTPGIYLAEWVVYQPDQELTFPRGSQSALQLIARCRI